MHRIINITWSRFLWVCLGGISLSLFFFFSLCSWKMLKMVVRLHKHGVSVGLKAPTVGDFKRVIFISDWGNFPLRLSEKNERKAEKERKREKNPLCKCKSVISGEVRWCIMPADCWRISLSLSSTHTHTHTKLQASYAGDGGVCGVWAQIFMLRCLLYPTIRVQADKYPKNA